MKYEFSDNIQRSILFLLKTNESFFSQIISIVQPDYFEFPIHTNLFNIITKFQEKYKYLPTEEFIIEEARRTLKANQDITDYEDELSLINNLNYDPVGHEEYYLDLVESFAKKEAIKKAITESVQLIKENNTGPIEEKIRKALLINRNIDSGIQYFSSLDARWDRTYNPETRDVFKTILRSINERLPGGGMLPGELIMVVGAPGKGKSLFLANQAVISLTEGRNVLYISLEMSQDRIAQRLDSITTNLHQNKLKERRGEIILRHGKFKKEFPRGEIVIKQFPSGLTNINHIRAFLSQLRLHSGFIPNLIIIDYLELLRPITEGMQEHLAQERIANEIRGLGVEQNSVVWTATQPNREGVKSEIITDAHLADSYGKIRVCDVALSINQTAEEFDEGKMRAFIIKNRNGAGNVIIPMRVDYNTLRMQEGLLEKAESNE